MLGDAYGAAVVEALSRYSTKKCLKHTKAAQKLPVFKTLFHRYNIVNSVIVMAKILSKRGNFAS
jgi:hypothetical protein